jgi:ubiquitin carboxyl-terminal hydrolase L3
MVPQPAKAVILLFPLTDDFKKKRDARYAQKLEQVGKGHIDPTIIWIKQTVRLGFILSFSLLMPGSIVFVLFG